MGKIGLVSVSIHNYGSLLQTYAMQKVLDNYGVKNEIILFKSDPIKQIYRIFNIPFMIMKLKLYKRKLLTKVFYKNIYKGAAQRDKEFSRFKSKYCRFTPKIKDHHKLYEMGRRYEAFVLGSDQVWNPANLEMDFYTLNFVPSEKAKIAYAPSFGVAEIPKRQIDKTKRYLSRIQYISVREKAGAKIIKELIDRDVPVVCDPTALLTVKQWNEIKGSKVFCNEKYIFCYFLGANPLHREFANKIKQLTGYKIVALQHIDEFVKEDLCFGDITPYDVGPQDFVSLVSDAEIVLTDSFHGTMFSVYYHKYFYSFPRYEDEEMNSTNSRIVSILTLLDISERLIKGNEDAEVCLQKTIDWETVQANLDAFRDRSMKYLTNALESSNLIEVKR